MGGTWSRGERGLKIKGQNESLCDHSLLCGLNLKERPQDQPTQPPAATPLQAGICLQISSKGASSLSPYSKSGKFLLMFGLNSDVCRLNSFLVPEPRWEQSAQASKNKHIGFIQPCSFLGPQSKEGKSTKWPVPSCPRDRSCWQRGVR